MRRVRVLASKQWALLFKVPYQGHTVEMYWCYRFSSFSSAPRFKLMPLPLIEQAAKGNPPYIPLGYWSRKDANEAANRMRGNLGKLPEGTTVDVVPL